MASRLLSASRAASYLGTYVFYTGFVSVVKDLKYLDSHEWVKVVGNSATVVITDHAQDHLGDVVYVELPEVGAPISQASSFIAVETVKSTSDINSPISGKVDEVNEELNDSPVLGYIGGIATAIIRSRSYSPTSTLTQSQTESCSEGKGCSDSELQRVAHIEGDADGLPFLIEHSKQPKILN